MSAIAEAASAGAVGARSMPRIIVAASLGTVFEYYDFLLYGSLAAFFGTLFFPPGRGPAALLASLATFGAGFAARPLGALLFGRLGDRIGRKATFLATILTMGSATALVGVLPTFAQIGWWAPALLVTLRLLQGLALGGEYGGAALYIAEHAPAGRRGYFTAWIQTNGSVGFILSLLAVLLCRMTLGEPAFRAWGWRIPFLASTVLLALSVYVRARLAESPLFLRIRAEGGLSDAPILESFVRRGNRRLVLVALVVAAPMALTWYTAQLYSLVFLQTTLQLDGTTAAVVMMLALMAGIPLYLAAGALSDRLGRRPVMLAGMLMFTLAVMPAYLGLARVAGYPGGPAVAAIGSVADFTGAHLAMVLLIATMVAGAAFTCGPGAAFLVELFPTRIRYTSLSLPYHLTSAWFGGFMPLTAAWLVSRTGNAFGGLWYPIFVSGTCFVLALWLMPETCDREL